MFGWSAQIGWIRERVVGNTRLLVVVSRKKNQWGVIALETPRRVDEPIEVLDNHAHEFVGIYRWGFRALWGAERYARNWQPGASSPCDCGPIEESTRPVE